MAEQRFIANLPWEDEELQEPEYYEKILKKLEKEPTHKVNWKKVRKVGRVIGTLVAPREMEVLRGYEALAEQKRHAGVMEQSAAREAAAASKAAAAAQEMKKLMAGVTAIQRGTEYLKQEQIAQTGKFEKRKFATEFIAKFAAEESIGTNRMKEIVSWVKDATATKNAQGEIINEGLDMSVMFAPEKDEKTGNIKGYKVNDPDFIIKKEDKEFKEWRMKSDARIEQLSLANQGLMVEINKQRLVLEGIKVEAERELIPFKKETLEAEKERIKLSQEELKIRLENEKKKDPEFKVIMDNASKKGATKDQQNLARIAVKKKLEAMGYEITDSLIAKVWRFFTGGVEKIETPKAKPGNIKEQIRRSYYKAYGKNPTRIYQKGGKWYIVDEKGERKALKR